LQYALEQSTLPVDKQIGENLNAADDASIEVISNFKNYD
jgi:hypothetical protein